MMLARLVVVVIVALASLGQGEAGNLRQSVMDKLPGGFELVPLATCPPGSPEGAVPPQCGEVPADCATDVLLQLHFCCVTDGNTCSSGCTGFGGAIEENGVCCGEGCISEPTTQQCPSGEVGEYPKCCPTASLQPYPLCRGLLTLVECPPGSPIGAVPPNCDQVPVNPGDRPGSPELNLGFCPDPESSDFSLVMGCCITKATMSCSTGCHRYLGKVEIDGVCCGMACEDNGPNIFIPGGDIFP